MRFALAILHAWIIMQTSMRAVLISPHPVLMMYTSSSRTDSMMRMLLSPMPFFVTSAFPRGTPSLRQRSQGPWVFGIDHGLHALRIAQRVTFVLYCISAGLVGIALISAIVCGFLEGRLRNGAKLRQGWCRRKSRVPKSEQLLDDRRQMLDGHCYLPIAPD